MMNVLVVHDRAEVGDQIIALVQEVCPAAQIDYKADGSTARDALSKTYFDLLILDLTIPNITGRGDSGFQVAEDLLEELVASSILLIPGGILGITQDAEALSRISNNIGPHLMALIGEDFEGRWRSQLRDRIEYVKNSAASLSLALLTKYDYDVLIFTALDKELAPFGDLFEIRQHHHIKGLSEFIFSDRRGVVRRGAAYAIGRAGQPSCASEAQGLICQLRPKLAIMTGFCGGIPGKADLGDILIAEMAVDWDYGKWKPTPIASRLYSRPEPISIRNSSIHHIAREFVERGVDDPDTLNGGVSRLSEGEITAPSIKLVPFASGSAVIGDQSVLESIVALNEGIGGVDMESFGFYFASRYAHAAKPEFICIKSVADDCGPDKSDRLHKSCCFSSAQLAYEIVTAKWHF